MAPSLLPPHLPALVLQYIAPPGQPIPDHLISAPLQKRHHFLDISAEDPSSYLCWPSQWQSRVVALLEAMVRPDPDDISPYVVCYTSEGEAGDTFAHVFVGESRDGPEAHCDDDSRLRLVFHWDDQGGWRYHDAGLMPFPPTAHPSLDTALESLAAPDTKRFSIATSADDDSYWNAYGRADDPDDSSFPTQSHGEESAQNEDAYWAQYTSVHGSGDSTIPSPVPPNSRVQAAAPVSFPGDVLCPSTSSLHGAPSPNALAALLGGLSPLSTSPPSPVPTPPSGEDIEAQTSPEDPLAPITPEDVGCRIFILSTDDEDASDIPAREISMRSPSITLTLPAKPIRRESGSSLQAADTALRERIRREYRLWLGRREDLGTIEEENREAFLRMVREVILAT